MRMALDRRELGAPVGTSNHWWAEAIQPALLGSGNEGSETTRKTQSATESRTRRVTTSGTHSLQIESHDRYQLRHRRNHRRWSQAPAQHWPMGNS
jgi:hypothetical protein